MQELLDRRVSEPESLQLIEEEKSDQLKFFGQFVSEAVETQYRQHIFNADKRQIKILLLVILSGTLLFSISDYRLFGLTSKLLVLIGVRILLITGLLILLFELKRINEPRRADLWLLIYLLVGIAGAIYINSTRPVSYTTHALIVLLEMCMIYLVFPLPLKFQMALAFLFSLGEILLLDILSPRADGLSNLAIIFCFSCANFLGIIVSRRTHYWKRQQFIALLRQTELRKKLQHAIGEIKTLRGIIPICASCKRIRQEAGAWERIEEYVAAHTHAQFSHGFCPECAEKSLQDYLKNKAHRT